MKAFHSGNKMIKCIQTKKCEKVSENTHDFHCLTIHC